MFLIRPMNKGPPLSSIVPSLYVFLALDSPVVQGFNEGGEGFEPRRSLVQLFVLLYSAERSRPSPGFLSGRLGVQNDTMITQILNWKIILVFIEKQ